MNLDPLSFALCHITNSVANLNKKNYKSSTQEIINIVKSHGEEAERQLLRCLFSNIDFVEQALKSASGSQSIFGGREAAQAQYLASEILLLLEKPYHLSLLCAAIDKPSHNQLTLKPSPNLLPQVCKVLRLSEAQEVTFGLALLKSEKSELVECSQEFLKTKLPNLCKTITSAVKNSDPGGGLPFSTELLYNVAAAIAGHRAELFDLTAAEKESTLKAVSDLVAAQAENSRTIVKPLTLTEDDFPMECVTSESSAMARSLMDNCLAEQILELGFAITLSKDECKQNLMKLGVGERATPRAIAKVLSAMIRTHSSMGDQVALQNLRSPTSLWNDKDKLEGSQGQTWNVENFVFALSEIAPKISWKDVIGELDHPGFTVKDRTGLITLVTALSMGLRIQHCLAFPIEHFYKTWINSEGQLHLFQQILKHPDVFCLADYPFTSVSVEILKSPPDPDNKDISTWKSLDLIKILLHLSDVGHHTQVMELMKFPVTHCPDVLALGLMQAPSQTSKLRQELLTNLMPVFLGNHPNAVIILQHAWHIQGGHVRPLVIEAMAEWYRRGDGDQTRLSRILEVAHDLKALSTLLTARPFPFVIDLACVASRREYLKLDKWLTDKIRDHGDIFITALVKFLQRKCPHLVSGKDECVPKSTLPTEIVTTILQCLQAFSSSASPETNEAIMSMAANFNNTMLTRPRQPMPGVLPVNKPGASQPMSNIDRLLNSSPNPTVGIAELNSYSGLSVGTNGLENNSFALNTPASLNSISSSLLSAQFTLGSPSGSSRSSSSGFSSLVNSATPSQAAGLASDLSKLFPDMQQSVSKDVEDEANGYFQRLYHSPNPQMSVDEVLMMLKKFQDSKGREKEVYNCMLRNLFEEYRFFPQYPVKELTTTAQLFGGIIEFGLVTYMALGIALRYVLDALRKPKGDKMYQFGLVALDRFRHRLKDYPQYCQHVTSISHFQEFPEHLIEYVEYGTRSAEPPGLPHGPVVPCPGLLTPTPPGTPVSTTADIGLPMGNRSSTSGVTLNGGNGAVGGGSVFATLSGSFGQVKLTGSGGSSVVSTSSRPSIANATNIDTLLVATEKEQSAVPHPPDVIQEKIAFIFNNLSQLNLQSKCDEMKEIVPGEEYWPWIAQYLVMKRASIEPNFHHLYSNFLDTLKFTRLNGLVLTETFRNIKILLRTSDKGIANFSDRSLLKNLGHWLGMLTVAKNKPILFVDLDLKGLLVEAYANGHQEMLYVVPFVAKILESCGKSRVFKPYNPWTMSIMNILAELHQEASLKLNLKFEIEVLCKNLKLELNQLKPTNQLKELRLMKAEQMPHGKKPEPIGVQQMPVMMPGAGASVGSTSDIESSHVTVPSAIGTGSVPATPSTPPNLGGGAPLGAPSVATPPPSSSSSSSSEAKFSYHSISINSLSNMSQSIVISPQVVQNLGMQSRFEQLKSIIRQAIDKAGQEWLPTFVDRSVKIAVSTSEHVVKKDFALDPDESRMRAAAHQIARQLTGALGWITCREHLSNSVVNNLKVALTIALNLGDSASEAQKELIEQSATIATNDNIDSACAFIQKTAMEKVIQDVDKRLSLDFELRKRARMEGRRYCDSKLLTYQAERLPEQVRARVGGATNNQMATYEFFNKIVPGFQPIIERELPPAPNFQKLPDDLTVMYDNIIGDINEYMKAIPQTSALLPHVTAVENLMDALYRARNSRDVSQAINLVSTAVEGLLEHYVPSTDPEIHRFREAHIFVLRHLQDARAYGMQWIARYVTKCWTDSREDIRWNIDAVDCLIRATLMNIGALDFSLAQAIENTTTHLVAFRFAMQLIQNLLVDNTTPVATEADFPLTLEVLNRVAASQHTRSSPEAEPMFGESRFIQNQPAAGAGTLGSGQTGNLASASGGVSPSPGGPLGMPSGMVTIPPPAPTAGPIGAPPPSLPHQGSMGNLGLGDFTPDFVQDRVESLIRDWIGIHMQTQTEADLQQPFALLVSQVSSNGMFRTDDSVTRFLRICCTIMLQSCYLFLNDQVGSAGNMSRNKCYQTLDAIETLFVLLVRHSSDNSNSNSKVGLIHKILSVLTTALLQDQETRSTEFQGLPYHRVFVFLLYDLMAPESNLEQIAPQIVQLFAQTMTAVQPSKAPSFAFGWLEVIAHRVFIHNYLVRSATKQAGWNMYFNFLVCAFKFVAPFLRTGESRRPVQVFFRSLTRILLMLLHDFPDFLSQYYFGICDVIPINCIQTRNVVLSAFPREMHLPDPFTPNLQVDLLSEITRAPRIMATVAGCIQPATFKKDLDSYLKTRRPVTFLTDLRTNLQGQVEGSPQLKYNIPLINALVLYVGTQAIAQIAAKNQAPSMTTITHSSHMDIFQNLAVDLDSEGRYLLFHSISNHLRFPNSHTHYFSCCLLYLFREANSKIVQEQIVRVLLERLIVNRPHPWGLLVTFIELLRNPNFDFWSHEFVHSAPEIEKLFENVGRSCMPKPNSRDQDGDK